MSMNLTDNNAGHTVVEILVALAILSVAVVPITRLAAKILSSSASRDLIVAGQLARAEIETAILSQDFVAEDKWIKMNQKSWHIEHDFRINGDLVTIRVRVYKKNAVHPLVVMETMRLRN